MNFMEAIEKSIDISNNGEIKVIPICNFCEKIYPDFFNNFNLYNQREDEITKLIKDNQDTVHYYGKPKEDFFLWQAIDEAKAAGKKFVIVENMS